MSLQINTRYTEFEQAVRSMQESATKLGQMKSGGKYASIPAIIEAAQKLCQDYQDIIKGVDTNKKAVNSLRILASFIGKDTTLDQLLGKVSHAVVPVLGQPSERVQKELNEIKDPSDAQKILEQLNEAEAQVDLAPEKQGWGSWLWGKLPAFITALINRVMSWSPQERAQLKAGLEKIANDQ